MKKLLALLLAAVMCLSLVACNSSDENADQIEHYENRIAELEAMLTELEAMLTERDETINRLLAEKENTETEITEPENTEPENTEPENTDPQYETVEITLDNWQDYFEIVEYMTYRDNAFGEAESCYFRYELRLKEEYWSRLAANMMDDKGAIEFSYDYGTRAATIDLANRTYSFGEFTAKKSSTEVSEFDYNTGDGNYLYVFLQTDNIGSWEIENGLLETARANFEIIRIRLVLCLIAE